MRPLVIVSSTEINIDPRTTEAILRELTSLGADARTVYPTQVSYIACDSGLVILDGQGARIDGAHSVLIKRITGAVEATVDLVSAFTRLGIRTIERLEDFINPTAKAKALLRRAGIYPSPKTWVAWSKLGVENMLGELVFPLIAKPNRGARGEGITSIDSLPAMMRYADEFFTSQSFDPLVLQQLIYKRHDYRVLVVGKVAIATISRIPVAKTSLAWNVAGGATPVPVRDRLDVEDLAVRVARSEQVGIAGVDIIEDTGGRLWLLECNRNPNFIGVQEAYPDLNIAQVIARYVLEGVTPSY